MIKKSLVKRILLFFVLPSIILFLLMISWLGRPASYIVERGGCITFNTNDGTDVSKYHHYRFEKCMKYNGLGVNVSMYDLKTNERVFSKTVLTTFDGLAFSAVAPIDCRIVKDKNSYEVCTLKMAYSSLYGAGIQRFIDYDTPRYYLGSPHEREYTEPRF